MDIAPFIPLKNLLKKKLPHVGEKDEIALFF